MSDGQGGTAMVREPQTPTPAESAEQRLAAEVLEPPTAGTPHPDTTGSKVGVNTAAGGTDEEIARRAYELYLARGGEHGFDMDDWIQAESELRDRAGLPEDRQRSAEGR
jgi:hypothetical protein